MNDYSLEELKEKYNNLKKDYNILKTAYEDFLKGENALIKRRYTVLECQNNYLESYKEALNLAIIYIVQMQLEKEKLQEEYDDLYEGHDKLSYEWAKLKKENRELNKKYNELLGDFNRINSEPLLRKMTIAELKERGFLRNESK